MTREHREPGLSTAPHDATHSMALVWNEKHVPSLHKTTQTRDVH